MGILQNYNEGNMNALRSVKYSETGTQAPYVVKDIKNPPQNNDSTIGLQLNTRIDDTSRIAQMLVDKPGLKFIGNQALLNASEIARKTKAAADKKRNQEGGATNAGVLLAGAVGGLDATVAAAGQVLKIVGSTLAQVPVNGTGTHFVRGFNTDTYINKYYALDLAAPARALRGAPIIINNDGSKGYNVLFPKDKSDLADRQSTLTEKKLHHTQNWTDESTYTKTDTELNTEVAETGGVILPDNVSPEYVPPITSVLKASGSSTPFGNTETELSKSRVNTPTPALAQSGSVITIQGGTATTATKETFGTTNQSITGSVAARQGYEIGPASTGSIEATNSTEENIANTQIGASIPLVKEEGARETTVTSGSLGVTSTVPEDLKTVTGGTTAITPFQIDSEKAKATSTDQENTQNVQGGNVVSLKGDTRQTTATSGNFGISSNVSGSTQTATGLQDVEASVFEVDDDKAKGKYATQQNTLNALTGSAVALKGDTRQTTATSGNFGISSNVPENTETVTGFQEIEATVFNINDDKAKGKSTTQENTLNALTGSSIPLKGDTRQTTESPGQGLVGGRSNSGITGNIIEPTTRTDNTYSSGSSFTNTNPVDNIGSMQKGQISFNDGNIPLRDNANLDTVSETSLSQNVTGDYTEPINPGTIQNFRKGPFAVDYSSPTINKETRVGLGNQGKPGVVRTNYTTDLGLSDRINKLDVSDKKVTDDSRDFIKFNFQIITPEDTTFLYFRALLTELSDSYTGAWDTTKYLGRAEDLYTYQGFSRSMNIGFNIAAASRQEMKPLYRKMAALASVTAPTYGGDGKFMRGTIAKVTVGDYIYEVPGIIESVNYTWNTDYNWEIAYQNVEGQTDDDMQELPQIMDCSLTFKPIHNFVPEAVGKVGGKTQLLPYITNPTPNGTGKAKFIE